MPTPKEEAATMISVLMTHVLTQWDGKTCISELHDADYQWRQMEWIGWWFEWKVGTVLREQLGGTEGPTYGNTQFDYRRNHVWDFKAHVSNSSSGTQIVLNDSEAIDLCIAEHSGVGFVIAEGNADYNDENATFKRWHDELKGSTSAYEQQRIARGARSRKRKVAFALTRYLPLFLTADLVTQGQRNGWLGYFQGGMRNADGSPRRPKYKLNLKKMPSDSPLL
jgi:hypothetical protein